MTQSARPTPVGRPEVTSHAAIEQAAFRLFAERGFGGTTMDAIAEAVGVGRRTLFRYYASKNDIPWGQFDLTLSGFRQILEGMPPDLDLREAVHRGVVAFNDFPADAQPPHRERMRLILETPALQAHSVLRYAQWRAVIAQYVAARLGLAPDDLVPAGVAQVSLAMALTAYEQWLDDDASPPLPELLDDAMAALRSYFGS
jgi:TetR/AcrR family transcriptional regulator, regulator of mycofactocin system